MGRIVSPEGQQPADCAGRCVLGSVGESHRLISVFTGHLLCYTGAYLKRVQPGGEGQKFADPGPPKHINSLLVERMMGIRHTDHAAIL